jgi:tRNA pseudouridine65 synthase
MQSFSLTPTPLPLGEGSDPGSPAGLPILYRDAHLIAIHKPAGLLLHRSPIARQETRFAVQLLRDQIGQPVWPVHRLDRGTSGLLLFALDPDVLRDLNRQFEAGQVVKTYLAVVRGWPPESGLIDHALAPVDDPYAPLANPEPRPAVTRYRRLAVTELPYRVDRYPTSRYALLALEPLTGRRHQLRRHLKHIAHPIIGDATYGKGPHNRLFAELYGCQRLWLACVEMAFRHPADGRGMRLTAPLAGEFVELLEKLGWAGAVPVKWRARA